MKKLTVWEAACIITGYGIGGGVMAMPYLAARCGIWVSLLILVGAYLFSLLMHMMLADLSLRAGGGQATAIYEKFLFRGRFKKALTILLFGMVALVLLSTLATYISGAGEIISTQLGIHAVWGRLIFYAVAAGVVLFGLKAVGISEKIAVALIFALLGVFAAASFTHMRNPLPTAPGQWNEILAFFGMSMFSFVAFFSIPQAVEGLAGDIKKIRKAVVVGFANIFAIVLIIVFCSLLSSAKVTEIAILGWSEGIGKWAQLVGDAFVLLAIVTTYWSISLALTDIIGEQTKLGTRLSWLLATAPTFLLTFLPAGFMEFLRITGGINAILLAIMVIPAFSGANKEGPTRLLGKFAALPVQLLVVAAYLVMAVGSLVTI